MNLGQWHHLVFIGLIGLSFLFLALQLVGGDHHHSLDHPGEAVHAADIHGGDLHEGPLSWLMGILNVGHLPASLLMTLFSFFWGAWGLLLNVALQTRLSPALLAFVLAGIGSLIPTVYCTRILAGGFGKLFVENSAASHPDDLVGCVGKVISGQIPIETGEAFGRAHVYSEHGTLLQLACVTQSGSMAIPQKHQTVFVTGYLPEQKLYTVVLYDSPDFQAYLSGPSPVAEQRLQKSQHYLETQQPSGGA